MRILIVEDENKAAAYLQKGLTESGFTVDIANTGTDGLHHIREAKYDLIILDVMLPGVDGWTLIQEIRARSQNIPVIFLTGRDSVADKVKGLGLGADDYLVKPFSFLELLARIHALLRRGQNTIRDVLTIADLQLDLIKHKAQRGAQKLDLTPKEFSLLTLLMQHQGELLTRTVIAEQVWGWNFDPDTNVIDVSMRRLRLKIDGDSTNKLIHTVRGIGYILEEREAT